MRKTIIQVSGMKDENGAFIKPQASIPDPDLSIDDMLKQSITGLSRAVKHIVGEITAGNVNREVIGNLKDVVAMLNELRKKEQDLMADMSIEELEAIAKGKKKGKK